MAGVVLTFAMISLATSIESNVSTVNSAKNLTRSSLFLQEVLDSIADQPFRFIPSLNGNVLYSGRDLQSSEFRADIAVTRLSVDLLRIRVVITKQRTGKELARVLTFRSKR